MTAYYFISFRHKAYTQEAWRFGNDVIDIHPFEWLGRIGGLEQFVLTYFRSINEKEYELFKTMVTNAEG